MCALIVAGLYMGLLSVRGAGGVERRERCGVCLSFVGVVLCMFNVWFAMVYAPLFWMTLGMVVSVAQVRLLDGRILAGRTADGEASRRGGREVASSGGGKWATV